MDARSRWVSRAYVAAVLTLIFAALYPAGREASAQTDFPAATAETSNARQRLAQYYYYFPNYPYPQVRRKKVRPRRRAKPKCAFPWRYSRGLKRCICVKEGYSLSGGECVKTAEICPEDAEWSQAENKCVCPEGFIQNAGRCTDPDKGVVTYNPAGDAQCLWPRIKSADGSSCTCAVGYREKAGQCVKDTTPARADTRPVAGPKELLTSNVRVVQTCLKEAGYLRAPVQDTMGRSAWTAFWFFKQDYPVGRTPNGIHDARAQHKLFTLCPQASARLDKRLKGAAQTARGPATEPSRGRTNTALEIKQAALTPPSEAEIKPAPEVKAPAKKVYARPEAGCLPGDLHKLVTGTYGPRPALKKCTQACIPMPANITKKEIEEFEVKRGVRWCRSCIEIRTQLPLEDILKIEQGANVQVCTRPPSKLPKWASRTLSGRPAYTRVRELYQPLPQSEENGTAVAVVIGNSTYGQGLPENNSALANAAAFYALLTEHMGFEQENIIDLRDVKLEDLTRVFGKAEDHKGELWQRIQQNPDARVFIYYTGHAGTRADTTDSYLLPVDAVKYREERSGYPMSQLYANLQKLEAKSVLVMIGAGFGRDLSDYVFPPNLPEMQVRALPREPLQGISVLTASDGDQKTLDDPDYGIGLFTRYLIEGLAGRADLAPIGNGDRQIDAIELYAYTSHMVRLSARKSFGLLQKPMMSRAGNLQVSRVQVQGQ